MPDLLTHTAVAYAVGRPARPEFRCAFLVGTLLPDILYKTALYLMHGSTWFCEPTHSPLTLVAAAYAGAMLFPLAHRRGAFLGLWLGSWLHLLLDAGKSYLGEGVIMWAFPFSMERFELGLYMTESTYRFMLPAVCAAIAAEVLFQLLKKRPRPSTA